MVLKRDANAIEMIEKSTGHFDAIITDNLADIKQGCFSSNITKILVNVFRKVFRYPETIL